MLDQLDILEVALRGAAAGVNVLLAGLILMSRAPRMRRWLAALFIFGTASYIIQSGPDVFRLHGPLDQLTRALAILNTVFFWWFARSLFEDDFRWTPIKIAPFAALVIMHFPWLGWRLEDKGWLELALHSSLSIVLLAHAVWIALSNRDDDLVGPRRRFRVAFATVIGIVGIVIAIGENIHALAGLPPKITLVHAVALASLTFFFAFWLLTANRALFGEDETPALTKPAPEPTAKRPLAPADQPAFDKLAALMDEGVYREEGLTVAGLAGKVGVAEHQLRRLINRELGFRNFTAFLNDRRIADAKADLADPEKARKQILQIALDLGYSSIAPFNRAFKNATGLTPTEFRKEKLNGD